MLGNATESFRSIGQIPAFNNHGGGNDLLDAAFRLLVDLDVKTGGDPEVVFEIGGTTAGLSLLYEAPSTLVLRAQSDRFVTARYVLPDSLLVAGELELVLGYDVDVAAERQAIVLFVNGFHVRHAIARIGVDWSDSDPGSLGVASDNLAGLGRFR